MMQEYDETKNIDGEPILTPQEKRSTWLRGKGGRKTKLTPEMQQQIVAFIRAGMWDYRAAEAAGVTRTTFYNWMNRGEADKHGIYREFFVEVTKAAAQAAGFAETRVYTERPFEWLRFGPGRARPDAPGWTDSAELTVHTGPIEVQIVYTDAAGRIISDSGRTAEPAHAADQSPAAATASVAGNGDRRG